MAILNFNNYIKEERLMKKPVGIAAGVALIYDNKILLVHPTSSSWSKGTCGIPKGRIEESEDSMEAALRELKEETGIHLTPDQLNSSPETVEIFKPNSELRRQLTYYVCEINSLDEAGLSSESISKDQLQAEEIDWAKFVGIDEAYRITSRSQLIILDRHLRR